MLFLLFAFACPSLGQGPEAAAPSPSGTQEKPFMIRSGVSNVRVDVDVRQNGQPIVDLKKEDFNIYDRGVQQEILFFDHGDEPLSVLLLLDISGSMEKYVGQVADVAEQSLKHLRPHDRVGVMIFARTDKVTQPFTSDVAAVEVSFTVGRTVCS